MAARAAVLALLLCASCGPTPAESAGAVLLALPVAIGVGHLLVRLLAWLWRPLRRADVTARPTLVAMAVAIGPALVAGRLLEVDLELALLALWLFGTTYLTVLLLVWRVWHQLDADSASTWCFVPAISLTVFPGLPLLVTNHENAYASWVVMGWMVVGYGGAVAGGLLAVLCVEALVRHRVLRVGRR